MSKSQTLTQEERSKIGDAWLELSNAQKKIHNVLNSSGSVRANEKLYAVYNQIKKLKDKLDLVSRKFQ